MNKTKCFVKSRECCRIVVSWQIWKKWIFLAPNFYFGKITPNWKLNLIAPNFILKIQKEQYFWKISYIDIQIYEIPLQCFISERFSFVSEIFRISNWEFRVLHVKLWRGGISPACILFTVLVITLSWTFKNWIVNQKLGLLRRVLRFQQLLHLSQIFVVRILEGLWKMFHNSGVKIIYHVFWK